VGESEVPPDELTTEDAGQLRDAVQRLTVRHTVEVRRGRVAGLTRARRLNRTNLVFVRYGTDVVVEAAPAGRRFALTLPLGPMSVGSARLGDRGDWTSSFVLSRERRTLMVPDPDAGAIVVAADADLLHRHLSGVLGYEVDAPVVFAADPAQQSVLPRSYLDAVLTGTWLAASSPVALSAASARLLEQNLLTALLLGLPHNSSALLRGSPAQASSVRAREARDWLEEHHAEPVEVTQVARAVGLGVRQLQAVFAQEHQMSPMELLREIRLERAHRLLTEGADHPFSVTEVAARCGFGHLGRFAGAYRTRFGERPSETLAKHRRGAGGWAARSAHLRRGSRAVSASQDGVRRSRSTRSAARWPETALTPAPGHVPAPAR
jgi:AraC-like DNA-binding protein